MVKVLNVLKVCRPQTTGESLIETITQYTLTPPSCSDDVACYGYTANYRQAQTAATIVLHAVVLLRCWGMSSLILMDINLMNATLVGTYRSLTNKATLL